MKFCTKCKIEKDTSDFYKSSSYKDGLRTYCKMCEKATNATRYIANKKVRLDQIQKWSDGHKELKKSYQRKSKKRSRLRDRLRKYKLSIPEFAEMLRLRENKCDICGRILEGKTKTTVPHVDHNHSTQKVRGILCHNCNQILGHSYDDANILKKAISYLEGGGTC